MRIYLDTAQFDKISKLPEKSTNPDKLTFWKFFEIWNSSNVTLCLSPPHLQEIYQLEDFKSRERRLIILENFKQIYYSPWGPYSIITFEAVAQLLYISSNQQIDPYKWVEKRIWVKKDLKTFLSYLKNDPSRLHKLSELYKYKAEMETLFIKMNKVVKKFSLQRFIKHNINISPFRKLFPEMYKNREKAEIWYIDIFLMAAIKNIPSIAKLYGYPENKLKGCLKKLNPDICPALSLRMALTRVRRSGAVEKTKRSDLTDEDHLVYAPYVDRFFVDKRTYAHLEQEIKRKPPRLESSFLSNIRRIGQLSDVLNEITNL